MPVTIKFDKNKCVYRITNAFNSNMGMLASEVLNNCNQYCKMDTGMLIASSYIHSKLDEGKLVWQTPYARRQYWEIKTANTFPNENASWRWCEVAKSKHLKQWNLQAQKYMEMNL